MRTRRAVAVVGAVVLAVLLCAAPGAASAAEPCPGAAAPGPAADASEVPRPGDPSPSALPVPENPVGGEAMGACGTVVAEGSRPPPTITPESYVVADLDSGEVLAARAPHARLRPASTLKTLLALLVARNLPMDETVVASGEDADQQGSHVGLQAGGSYTVEQLLQGLLLPSGNDAAHALAVRLTGSVDGTVALMNRTAASLGALDTRAATPSGLDGPGMSSSAYDLASIFRVAMREPAFARTTATRQVPFPGVGGAPPTVVTNENRLLTTYPGTIGGKTGFTTDAQHTYIAAADRGGRRLVVVLMRGEEPSDTMFRQATSMLDWGFAQPRDRSIGELSDAAQPEGGPAAEGAPASAGADLAPISGSERTSANWTVPVVIGGVVALVLLVVALRWRDRAGTGGRRRRRH